MLFTPIHVELPGIHAAIASLLCLSIPILGPSTKIKLYIILILFCLHTIPYATVAILPKKKLPVNPQNVICGKTITVIIRENKPLSLKHIYQRFAHYSVRQPTSQGIH